MDFETRKVEWSKDWSLAEVYSGGLQMALCSPPNEEGVYKKATPFVTCKDFFQDATQAFHLGEECDIFDFKYDPKKHPALSFDRTRIMIGNTADKELGGKVAGVLDFVNQFEKKIKLIRTQAFKCDPTPAKWEKSSGVYLFEGSGRWMIAPPMISLYTLLLRCGFVHKVGDDFDKTCKEIIDGKLEVGSKGKRNAGCYDDIYLRDSQAGIKALLEHGYARLFYKDSAKNFPKKIDTDTMHDRCGIVGWSQKSVKAEMPYWYRLIDPKKKAPAKKPAAKKAAAKQDAVVG